MPSANTYRVPDSEDELRQFGIVVAQALEQRGLAALYSSMLTPIELRTIGYLRGADCDDDLLQTLFSRPAPWMPEVF